MPPSTTPAIDNLDALDEVLVETNRGLEIPFELVCLSCSSQGVRVVIPPGGACPRCQPNALNRSALTPAAGAVPTVSAAVPEREPIGCWCIGGLAGTVVPFHGRRPSWVEQAARRILFRDVWLDWPHKLEIPH